ncbi:MAG: glutamate formimidoyltransferase [Acholeplasmatales bacterium]|jgi:glutamate formiminotransferase|nr:glutamate formimidoyltransferase [Acholeplasmataceae bacterium]MDY0115507.1 glutamate formimidoyltransferase [Acholeplasmatales bacterium]
MKIVQCVPNISEGTDLKKIDRIVAPLKNQKGFKLVNIEADSDYNRTVITIIGDPDEMINPLLKFIENAKLEIDMNYHQGEHPRMGAVDVIPFIPIKDVSMEECINYANLLAEKVASELTIPVYLYAEAAKTSKRKNLPTIRRGEFEGMKEKITLKEWEPDYGEAKIHPSFGVVAIGARLPLIAYNIDLGTDDEKIANNVARAIRKSSGGFAFVQAGPVFLEERGHVQVTMNILDFKKNPLYRVLETVRMELKRYQVAVLGSEVIGLIPKEALLRSLRYYLLKDNEEYNKEISFLEITNLAKKYLQLRDFDSNKIIEANLGD